jgi:hypothetical protein
MCANPLSAVQAAALAVVLVGDFHGSQHEVLEMWPSPLTDWLAGCRSGSEVLLYDPRPNGELLLATGAVPDTNPSDYLLWDASLVQVSWLADDHGVNTRAASTRLCCGPYPVLPEAHAHLHRLLPPLI